MSSGPVGICIALDGARCGQVPVVLSHKIHSGAFHLKRNRRAPTPMGPLLSFPGEDFPAILWHSPVGGTLPGRLSR
jgi:hypothetical protein